MAINDDFNNKAEAEMKMHDAKMMELALVKKLATATIEERIRFALKKRNDNPEEALEYLTEHHLILAGEKITVDTIKDFQNKK
jgi:hypothetical protein